MRAVEFIKKELNKLGLLDKGQVMTNIFEQAKQMEKEQLENAEIESLITIETFQKWKVIKEQAKQNQKEQIIEHLIAFQIYLNNKELITNHDWDFEKLAKQYIKKECK